MRTPGSIPKTFGLFIASFLRLVEAYNSLCYFESVESAIERCVSALHSGCSVLVISSYGTYPILALWVSELNVMLRITSCQHRLCVTVICFIDVMQPIPFYFFYIHKRKLLIGTVSASGAATSDKHNVIHEQIHTSWSALGPSKENIRLHDSSSWSSPCQLSSVSINYRTPDCFQFFVVLATLTIIDMEPLARTTRCLPSIVFPLTPWSTRLLTAQVWSHNRKENSDPIPLIHQVVLEMTNILVTPWHHILSR